ncbi:hypothetical protein SAMN05216410_2189 [Sanguibacter gelidistatuariae]|uniref:DinB-like domain-containing protein n=1 Tax=Sanguibacter gelidistatuariae TaxID=1814289 RepID=A0A1G6NQ74_9MICO|nr:DinB family protein [Sanguibacter gelidistatuariae]SDC69325.1 hypothetical protein SAMN05216410_2189 [Sanguibacter gelidistatuariae]
MTISPDTKNWTWVTERACPECGFDAPAAALADIPARLQADVERWPAILGRADVATRPDDHTWSVLEYGAHVRDVFVVFSGRFARMITEDDPLLEDWDQDAAATAGRYGELDPLVVADQLVAAGEALAAALEAIPPAAANRAGLRSDGSRFTVESLARYLMHDVAHHLWDVTRPHS